MICKLNFECQTCVKYFQSKCASCWRERSTFVKDRASMHVTRYHHSTGKKMLVDQGWICWIQMAEKIWIFASTSIPKNQLFDMVSILLLNCFCSEFQSCFNRLPNNRWITKSATKSSLTPYFNIQISAEKKHCNFIPITIYI